jgi:glycosyltransferase involved in cell wall biosynthesis
LTSSTAEPLRLLLVISNLSIAGSQQQLLTLATHLDKSKFTTEVCTLSPSGELELEFGKLGIPLWRIARVFRWGPEVFFRFARLCRQRRIQVVHSYLDFDNLVSRIGGRLGGVPLIISSERSANYVLPGLKELFDRLTIGLADLVITNSSAGKQFLIEKKRVRRHRVKVIHNSIDPNRLHTDKEPGDIRRQFGIPADAVLIGMVAERRTEKNFGLFFDVADVITSTYKNAWFLQVGGLAPTFEKYNTWVERRHGDLPYKRRIILGGRFEDMGALYRDLDILLLTSDREGFSNVLMEGMVSGLPVVATDVGDNAEMVDHGGGFLTPLKEKRPMVEALTRLITNDDVRREMSEYNRKKAGEQFSVHRLVSETEEVILQAYRAKMGTSTRQSAATI